MFGHRLMHQIKHKRHCFDGGDCSRKEVKMSKCNDRSCCTEAAAIAEICKPCNCNEVDQSDPICKECCLNGSQSIKVTSSVIMLLCISSLLNLV